MKIVQYLREKGVKRALTVLWQYKIELFLERVLLVFYKRRPLKNIIVLESHNDFDCNGGAFYDYLIKNELNKKYKIVWLVRRKYKVQLPYNVTTVPLNGPSFRKAYYMCTYKYMLFDCEGGRKTKSNQCLTYCSHGAGGLKASKGKIILADNIDYILVQSKQYMPIQAKQWSLTNKDPRFIYVGYPAHDILLNEDGSSELKKLTAKKYKKTILWMPTFRKGIAYQRNDSTKEQALGIPLIQKLDEYNELNDFLMKHDICLIIKLHPKQDIGSLKITNRSNIKVLTASTVKEKKIDNYRLMKSVDALVSDYSGAAYEFLQINRPIAYVLDDMQDYKLGFVVDDIHSLIAGKEIYTLNDLQDFIKDIAQEKDPYRAKRQQIRNFIYNFHDTKSCERLAKILEL